MRNMTVNQMDWQIPLFKIYWDEDDVEMVKDAIQRGMFWAIGQILRSLRKQARIGSRKARR